MKKDARISRVSFSLPIRAGGAGPKGSFLDGVRKGISMTIANDAKRSSARGRGLVLLLGLGLGLALAASRPAAAQCTLAAGPVVVDPGTGFPGAIKFAPMFYSLGLYKNGTGYHVVTQYNYGYGVFKLNTGPTAAPSATFQSYKDIHILQGYINQADGQTNLGAVGVAPDGSSLLISYFFADHANLVLTPGQFDGSFELDREFPPTWGPMNSGGFRVDLNGNRQIAYMIETGVGLYASDISASSPVTAGFLYSEKVLAAPTSQETIGLDLAVSTDGSKRYVVYSTGGDTPKVVVVDVSAPGPAGSGLTRPFVVTSLDPTTDFGLPAGAYVRRARAAFHPDGTLQILAEGVDSANRSVGIALRTFDTLNRRLTGARSAYYMDSASPFLGKSGTYSSRAPALIATGDDLIAFVWEGNATSTKLFSFSSNSWGTDLSPQVIAQTIGLPSVTEGFFDGSDFYLLTGELKVNIRKVTCVIGSAPATSSMSASKATAFVGDTLTLTRSISPTPNAGTSALTGWDMDFDYHASTEKYAPPSFPLLSHPDITLAMSTTTNNVGGVGQITNPSTYPATLSFTGPCDPSRVSPNNYGGTCWGSVVDTDVLTAIPSVSGSVVKMEDEGSAFSTSFAFEAANGNTSGASATGSANLTVLPVTWKVPRVLIQKGSSSSITPDSAPASAIQTILVGDKLYSAAEGSPLLSGYRWYFETYPGSGVFGQPDAGCGGPSCSHDFAAAAAATPGGVPARPWNFAYWLTVPYPAGYTSEDYPGGTAGASVSRKRGTITVNDAVLGFTVPTSIVKNAPSIPVTDLSIRGGTVVSCPSESASYQYALCQEVTAGVPCGITGSVYSDVIVFGNKLGGIAVPVPASYPAKYWLRIRYTYVTSGSCPQAGASPQIAYWAPGVSLADSTAWPITVQNVQPTIDVQLSGLSLLACSLRGTGCPTVGQSLVAVAYDQSTPPKTKIVDPSSNYSWSLPGATMTTATGSPTPSFTYNTAGSYAVYLNAYGVDVTPFTIFVNAVSGGGGGGGTPNSAPTITYFNIPSTAQAGQAVGFNCSASGSPTPSILWTASDGFSGAYGAHAFANPGSYTVTCTASNGVNPTASQTGSITITPAVVTYDAKIRVWVKAKDPCVGNPFCTWSPVVAATGDALTAYAYDATGARIPDNAGTFAWTFGHALPTSASTQTNGTAFAYSQAGTFTDDIHLTFTPANGTAVSSGTASATITSTGPAVTLQVGASASSAKIGTPITFTATAGSGTPPFVSYSWTFGDQGTGSGASIAHSWASAGTFQVSCTVVDSLGTSKSATTSVTVLAYDPVTLQVQAAPASGTIGGPISFTASAGGGTGTYASYTWDFGDQGTGSGATVSHTYTKTGLYTATCTVKDSANNSQTASTAVTIGSVQLWLVPGVAWVSGQGGAEWQSDLSVFNPSSSPMNLQVAFLDGSKSITSIADLNNQWKTISVAPKATRAFTNIISSLFNLVKGNYGAILVRGDNTVSTEPVITGSTYDTSRGAGGTVGLSLAAMSLPSGAGAGILAAGTATDLIGLRDEANNHTNLAIANLYNDYVTARVTFMGANGTQLGQPVTMQLNPFGVQQLTNALTAAPPAGAGYDKGANQIPAYRAHIELVSGTAILPYASVIDDISKDPVLVTGTKIPASTYRIPGMVRTEGKAGTLWRSDLVIYNTSSSARSVQIAYSWVDANGIGRISGASIPFAPGEIKQWLDFVRVWLGIAESDTSPYINAFVDVSPADGNADPILVTSRVYNNQPTGNVGLGVPGYTSSEIASGTGAKTRLILAGLRSDANYRSNVALFLASGAASSSAGATLKVYDANGTFLAASGIGLTTAGSFIQLSIDNLVANSGGDKSNLSVVVENLTGAPISGYATIVDNRSGDGTLIQALPIP